MQFSTEHHYAAEPRAVYAMLTDPDFFKQVFTASGAPDVTVDSQDGRTTFNLEIDAPDKVQRFTGARLTGDLSIDWTPLSPEGSSQGPIAGSVNGVPADIGGTAQLAPDGTGTSVTFEIDLSIHIPFLGRQLENRAGPYLQKGLDIVQQHGNVWLREHA